MKQRGFTLIELLVAMTIGLFLIAGLAMMYLSSSQVSRLSQKLASTSEGAQMLMLQLKDSVRMAGYGEVCCGNPNFNAQQTLFSGDPLRACPAGTRFSDPSAMDFSCAVDGTAAGDSLMVQFQGTTVLRTGAAPPVPDCIGGAPVVETIAATTGHSMAGTARGMVRDVYVLGALADGVGDLQCAGSSDPGTRHALIGGVEEFKLYFGYDSAGIDPARPAEVSGVPRQSSIVDAQGIVALAAAEPNAWKHVVAVHVCLRLRTSDRGSAGGATVRSDACPVRDASGAVAEAVMGAPVRTTLTDGIVRRTFRDVLGVRSQSAANPL